MKRNFEFTTEVTSGSFAKHPQPLQFNLPGCVWTSETYSGQEMLSYPCLLNSLCDTNVRKILLSSVTFFHIFHNKIQTFSVLQKG